MPYNCLAQLNGGKTDAMQHFHHLRSEIGTCPPRIPGKTDGKSNPPYLHDFLWHFTPRTQRTYTDWSPSPPGSSARSAPDGPGPGRRPSPAQALPPVRGRGAAAAPLASPRQPWPAHIQTNSPQPNHYSPPGSARLSPTKDTSPVPPLPGVTAKAVPGRPALARRVPATNGCYEQRSVETYWEPPDSISSGLKTC